MSQVTTGKDRSPQSLRYNCLSSIQFPTITLAPNQVSTTVQARLPLALNMKIMAVSYIKGGSSAGISRFNIVRGPDPYETAGGAAAAFFVLGGTYDDGDTITVTVGGISQAYVVNTRIAGDNNAIAAYIAASINQNTLVYGLPWGNDYYAFSISSAVIIVRKTYASADNSITFAATKSSASGTILVPDATFTNGSDGIVPTMPALDNSNITSPSQTAAAGTALFPVDMPLNTQQELPVVLYTVNPNNFEAIWPSASELTVRVVSDNLAGGTLDIVLWGVPYDVQFYNPEDQLSQFLPSPTNL